METEDDFECKPHLIFDKNSDFPIEYTCQAVLVEGTFADSFPFTFDYEITLENAAHGEFQTDVRRSFEWNLLWNVAMEIGLHKCLLDPQGLQPGPTGFQVVALGSQYDDVLDTEPAEKDPSIADGTCFSQDPACIPMKGMMNAKYIGNEVETQQYLVKTVEKVLGTNSVLVVGVSSVRYIGDRGTFYNPSLFKPSPLTISSLSNQNDSDMQSLGTDIAMGTAIGLGVVVILLAGLFVARRVRNKRTRKARFESRMSITSIEIDVESVDTKETQATLDESTCDVDAFIEEEEPSSSDNPAMADIPPVALKSVSLPSKRKRRRKKKKKRKKNVMSLTRSNSVTSMDTITEEDEQDHNDDDDGSDYGSECWSDDEEQDLKRSDSYDSWSEPWDSSPQCIPLEEIVESPKIRKLPPPPV